MKWRTLLKLGIALSVMIGMVSVTRLQSTESWIQKGLYFTFLWECARSVDRTALFVVPGLLAIWLAFRADQRLSGGRRILYRAALGIGLLVAVELRFGIVSGLLLFARYPDRLVTMLSMFSEDLPRLGLAFLLIAGVVDLQQRIRAYRELRREDQRQTSQSRAVRWCFRSKSIDKAAKDCIMDL